MSHLKEREEKICLNCNAAIYGRFCHVCGQENLEPHESFWHLLTHFLFDLIHFDGKFFSTLKYLLFKPGFLAEEHARGRRADYLHPIRLYIFVSAFFFLIMFTFYGNEHETKKEFFENKLTHLENKKETISKAIKEQKDSFLIKKVADSFIAIINNDIVNLKTDSSRKRVYLSDNLDNTILEKEDEVITSKLDNFPFADYLNKKEKEYSSTEEFNKKLIETMIHSIPKVLFIALPFYALFLMMFYARNKKYNYVNHLLFSIYLFSFTFILILCSIWIVSLFTLMHINIEGLVTFIAIAIAMLYTYKALRNYYKQSRIKTILKFILLSLSCFIIFLFIFFLLFIYSAGVV